MTQPLLDQLRTARENASVSAGGAWFGAVPTSSAFILAHYALPELWDEVELLERFRFWGLLPVLVACLLFSVQTIWQFTARFGRSKAACTIVVLEGVMVLSPYIWHAAIALACLVLVNAVATACTLVAEEPRAEKPVAKPVSHELNPPRKLAARPAARGQLEPSHRPAT